MQFAAGSRYSEVAVASFVEITDDLLAYQPQVIGAELGVPRFMVEVFRRRFLPALWN